MIKISKLNFILLLSVLGLVVLVGGFNAGYNTHSNSLVNLAEDYLKGDIIAVENGVYYGKTDCWERAFVLSAWLPFKLTEDLQVKDCQEIEWLYAKFQKQYFSKIGEVK